MIENPLESLTNPHAVPRPCIGRGEATFVRRGLKTQRATYSLTPYQCMSPGLEARDLVLAPDLCHCGPFRRACNVTSVDIARRPWYNGNDGVRHEEGRIMRYTNQELERRLTIRIPSSQHAQLERIAHRTGGSIAEIVRVLLEDVLGEPEDEAIDHYLELRRTYYALGPDELG